MADGLLVFPAPHFLLYHLCVSMLSTVHCVYKYKMAGQPRSEHWEVLESRIMDVWQAGKKLGWVCSLIMRSFAFWERFSIWIAHGGATDVIL